MHTDLDMAGFELHLPMPAGLHPSVLRDVVRAAWTATGGFLFTEESVVMRGTGDIQDLVVSLRVFRGDQRRAASRIRTRLGAGDLADIDGDEQLELWSQFVMSAEHADALLVVLADSIERKDVSPARRGRSG